MFIHPSVRLEIGERRVLLRLRMVPGGDVKVVRIVPHVLARSRLPWISILSIILSMPTSMIVPDSTEQWQTQAEERWLAEEQAALRRIATLVASDASPEQVFQAVTEEACRLLDIPSAVLERFEDERTATIVGRYGDWSEQDFEVGTVIPLEEGLAALDILRTAKPVPIHSYDGVPGEVAARMRAVGLHSAGGVPITVAGRTWGALIAGLGAGQSLSAETERRMHAFAELVALAVASAHTRDELAASRRRIIEAGDAERRRLERNLHDGAQQRLVSLSISLRVVQRKVRRAPDEAEELLDIAVQELTEALAELRELAHGIHPAVLTERGLEAALEALTARVALPVALEVRLTERLPQLLEVTAYYVASEALANVVKHARADSARVRAERLGGRAVIEVADDGIGGADADNGSGLGGLRDRVETLGGTLEIESSPGHGTLIRAQLPIGMEMRNGDHLPSSDSTEYNTEYA
jgi:signal transduction histidine kinase